MTDEPPASAGAPGSHAGPATYITGVLIAIFMFMFVLPGFVSGLYTRTTGHYITTGPMMMFIYPAVALADRSPALDAFYNWEYRAVGGKQ